MACFGLTAANHRVESFIALLPDEQMNCRICQNGDGNRRHLAREMMYGFRDLHPYVECSKCGCLQIEEFPTDLSKYYNSSSYYSYQRKATPSRIKRAMVDSRSRYALFQKGLLGKLLYMYSPAQQFDFLGPIKQSLTPHSRVIDVGCGAGILLQSLHRAGMKRLLGVDPFIDQDITYEDGLRIRKMTLHQVEGAFDLIMFHHSFEHIPEQAETLQSAYSRLDPGGYCIVRIPIVSSYAWKHYGVNWVQLDAPRHFFLHSLESFQALADSVGFQLLESVYDSTEFQLWGSEQYAEDIPLMSESSYAINPTRSRFSPNDIKLFRERSAELNAAKQGDQAIFYLCKPV